MVYLLKRSFGSALLVFLAGIPLRIGWSTECRDIFLTQKIYFNKKQHEAKNFLDVLMLKQPNLMQNDDLIFLTDQELIKASEYLAKLDKKSPIWVVSMKTAPFKMWSEDKWAKVIRALQLKKYQIILAGATSDLPYYLDFLDEYKIKVSLNLAESNLTLREQMAVYKLVDGLISVDSGPVHLANAVGTKTIVLFGESDANRWHPWRGDNYIILQNMSKLLAEDILRYF